MMINTLLSCPNQQQQPRVRDGGLSDLRLILAISLLLLNTSAYRHVPVDLPYSTMPIFSPEFRISYVASHLPDDFCHLTWRDLVGVVDR